MEKCLGAQSRRFAAPNLCSPMDVTEGVSTDHAMAYALLALSFARSNVATVFVDKSKKLY
jgi:hypothetical protein